MATQWRVHSCPERDEFRREYNTKAGLWVDTEDLISGGLERTLNAIEKEGYRVHQIIMTSSPDHSEEMAYFVVIAVRETGDAR